MFFMSPISFTTSHMGIAIKYTCYSIGTHGGNKCPDKKSDKCYKCKYCVAQMQADDAAKLLRVFDEKMS